MLHPRSVKVLEVWGWLLFEEKLLFPSRDTNLKKLSLIMTSSCHEPPCDTHLGEVNRAKLDVLRPVILEELKHTETELRFTV